MKTTQYQLYLEICENVIYNGEISKKQYQDYIKQMEYNKEHEDEVETKPELIEDKFIDYTTYKQHTIHYNVAASHIILSEFKCKPGYTFTK